MTSPGTLRIGLVGAGGISHAHLPHLLALGSEVVVYAEDGAEELVAAHGGRTVDSLDALLEAVDVVDVVTPTPTHHAIVGRALDAGKHVISEKPLARTLQDAQDLCSRADAAGRHLFAAHVVRYFPEYVQLHEAVTAGRLGSLAVLRFFRSGAFPIRTSWFADRQQSGGIVLDQMIHDIDVARWVAGDVVRVFAASHRHDGAEPIEAAHVLLTHASGAISHIAGTWGPQHLRFTTGYSVTGTGGTLEHDSRDQMDVVEDFAAGSGNGAILPDVDPGLDPYYLELRDFMTAIEGGPTPRVTAEDAVAAVRIALAAVQSIDTGETIELAQPRTEQA